MRRWLFLIALFVPVMAHATSCPGGTQCSQFFDGNGTSSGSPFTQAITNAGGSTMIMAVMASSTSGTPVVTISDTTFNGWLPVPNPFSTNGCDIAVTVSGTTTIQCYWYAPNISAGSNTVNIAVTPSSSNVKYKLSEYTGAFAGASMDFGYFAGSTSGWPNGLPTPGVGKANDIIISIAGNDFGTTGTFTQTSSVGSFPLVDIDSAGSYGQLAQWDTLEAPAGQVGQDWDNTGGSNYRSQHMGIIQLRTTAPAPIIAGCKAGYAGVSAGPPATGLTCVMPTVNAGDNLFLVNTQNTGNHIASITGCDSGATLGWTKKWESLQGQVYYLLGATSQTNCTVTLTFDGSGAVFFTSMIVFRCTDCNAYPVSVQPKGYGAAGSYQATMSDIAVGSNEPDSFLVAMAAGYNSSNPFGFSTASSGWSAIDGITSYSPSRTQGTSTYAFYKEVTSAGSYPITISNGGIGSFLGSTFWMALRRTAPVYGTLQTGFATTARVGGTTPTTSLTVQFEQQPPPLSRVELTVFSHTFATSLPFAISTTGGLICPTELPWIAPGLNDVGDTIAPTVMCTVPASPSGNISATFTDAGTPIDWDLLAVNDLNLAANTSTGTALWASSMFNSPTTVTTMDTGPMFVQPNGSASSLFLQGLVSGSTSQQSTEVDLLTPSSPYVPRFQPEYNLMLNEWFDGTLTVSGTVPTGQDFSVTSVRGQVDSATQQAAWGIGAPYTFPVIVAQRLANAFGGPTTIDITEPSIGGALVLCVASNPGSWALPTTSPSVTWHLLVGGGASDWLEQAVAFNVPAGKISITQQQVGTNNTFFSVTKVTKISAIDATGYSGAGTVTSPVTTGVTPHDATDYLSVCGGTLDNLSGAGGGIDGPAGTYLSNKFLGKTDGNAANVFDSYLQTPATYSLTYTIDSGGPAALGMTAFNYIAPPVANVQPFVNLITKNDPARYMGEWRK